MPHLVEMQNEYGGRTFTVIGVTSAGVDEVRTFMQDHGVNYPILAEAGETVNAYGISVIWGSPTFLVDPDGRIVAEDFKKVQKAVAERLGPPDGQQPH